MRGADEEAEGRVGRSRSGSSGRRTSGTRGGLGVVYLLVGVLGFFADKLFG